MSERMTIQSHKGPYHVDFHPLEQQPQWPQAAFFLIDERVYGLHRARIDAVLAGRPYLLLTADEDSKTLDRCPGYIQAMVDAGIRRDWTLVAIGGGVIQDITCFLSSCLMRGLPWWFIPTTLLAQTDSCIGSKSSINSSGIKNIVGTFTPPSQVIVDTRFLDTLERREMFSGIGEIIKALAIDGPQSVDRLAGDHGNLFHDRALLRGYIRQALHIKKRFIEADEFDRGIRNLFNYGHSFGHAIEAATNFAVPHGVAVAMGMDVANFTSASLGIGTHAHYQRIHGLLMANYAEFVSATLNFDAFLSALSKDKKNTGAGNTANLVLPHPDGSLGLIRQEMTDDFRTCCKTFLSDVIGLRVESAA